MHKTHQELYTSWESIDKCYAFYFLIILKKKKKNLWSFFENLKDFIGEAFPTIALTCQVLFDLYVHLQYLYFMFIFIESNISKKFL